MARNRIVPSLPELLASISRRTAVKPAPELPDNTPERFPVAVKASTRSFLQAQADALGTSIAAIGGTILDAVAAESLQEDGGAAAFRHIADRVFWLIREHRISLPAAADHLARTGLDGQALRSSAALERALSFDQILEIARFFGVERDWLVGNTSDPLPPIVRSWFGNPGRCAAKVALLKMQGATVRVIFLRSEGAVFDRSIDDQPNGWERTGFIPVICREFGHQHEPLRTYEVLQSGQWSNEKMRKDVRIFIKLLDQFRVIMDGYEVPPADFQQLSAARVLPVSVMPRRACHFMPEDYSMESESPGKDVEEWKQIAKSERFQRERSIFDQLMSGETKL